MYSDSGDCHPICKLVAQYRHRTPEISSFFIRRRRCLVPFIRPRDLHIICSVLSAARYSRMLYLRDPPCVVQPVRHDRANLRAKQPHASPTSLYPAGRHRYLSGIRAPPFLRAVQQLRPRGLQSSLYRGSARIWTTRVAGRSMKLNI
jgi:hypothetical protein